MIIGGTGQTEQSGGSSDSVVSPAVYLGAGIGGGLVIVVLFVLVFLVILWLKRSRKLERRYRNTCKVVSVKAKCVDTSFWHVTFYCTCHNNFKHDVFVIIIFRSIIILQATRGK